MRCHGVKSRRAEPRSLFGGAVGFTFRPNRVPARSRVLRDGEHLQNRSFTGDGDNTDYGLLVCSF